MISPDAIAALEHAVGREAVCTSPGTLSSAATATFRTEQTVAAIVRPGSAEEVKQCLEAASRHGLSLYPISSGKNWGYGSRVPVKSGSVILDLSRMNRILDFNEELGWVTIEPGVTQRQLFLYLQERKSRLWMDATGSTPDASIIGNTMERGFGHTPYGDHAGTVCGIEAVLPDGTLLRTGMARFDRAHAAPTYRWGLGPSLDGLFMQSNLGIVTRMTLWLMPAPDCFEAFFFRCDNHDGLATLIDALRPLRMNGTLRSAIHIANDYRVLAGIRQYPWEVTDRKTPLRPATIDKLRKELGFGAWNGSGGLYGTKVQVREAKRMLRRALAGHASRLQFLNETLLGVAGRFTRLFGFASQWDVTRALSLVRPVFGLMQGKPTDRPLFSAYWRKPSAPPQQMDPDRDGCGLLWYSPVAPAQGQYALELARIASDCMLAHGFEPMISITMITERALIGVISLTWDRDVAGEDSRAQQCFDDLQKQLVDAGYPPYRLGIRSMDITILGGGHEKLLNAIRDRFDPERILAPGRYDELPRASRSSE